MNESQTFSQGSQDLDRRTGAWLFPAFLLGAAAALGGGYWDDAWHTERGRDSFFIAPHLAIYGGVTLVGAALALWTLAAVRHRGLPALRSDPALGLGLICVVVTLASAPIDNAWHVAFGRDAVIWSPPHLLGIVGMMGLAVGALLRLDPSPAVGAQLMRAIAGGLVFAAAGFVVVEYETDVPQFAAVWYLPVLTLAASVALALVRLASPDRWAGSRAAAIQLAFILVVSGFLLAQGFDAPRLPLLVVPVLAFELADARRLPAWSAAVAFVVSLFVVYGAVRDVAGRDLILGFPLALTAALVVLVGSRAVRASVVTAVLVVACAFPAVALAHDPGQGPDAGTVGWRIRAANDRVAARVVVPRNQSCASLQPRDLVARRAGRVIRAPLLRDGCVLRAQLRVPGDGRWFIYATFRRGRENVETWEPITLGDAATTVADPERFAYRPDRESATAAKYAGGALLYAAMVTLLIVMLRLARRASELSPS